MANSYYVHGSYPATGSSGSSAAMRAELDAITTAFDKLPSLTATYILRVNAGGTALEAISPSAALTAIGGAPSASPTFSGTVTIGSLTGLLKGASGVVSAAASGTDYAPATSGSAILKGNGTGGFSSAVAGTDYLAPAAIGVTVQAYDATYVVDADIGVTVQGYDVDTAKLDTDQSWTGSQRATPITDADGSFDMNAGNDFLCTPTGNITLVFTNYVQGQRGSIYLDNSGGHTISITASRLIFPSGLDTTLTATGKYWVSYWCVDATSSAEVVLISATTALT